MSHMSNQEKAIYALLADNVYWDVRSSNKDKVGDYSQSNWTPVPSDWKIIHEVSNSGSGILSVDSLTNGFTARAFQKGNEIVIAFAGTNPAEVGDLASDIQLGIGTYSNQANSASIMYHEIKEKYPNADIKFTGHSLGGGLAGIMGILFDKEAIIFDPAPFKKSVMETDIDENINTIKKLKKGNIYTIILDYVAEKYTESNINAIKKALEEQIEKNKEANQGFTEIDKSFLNYNYEKHYSQRVEKLTAIAVKGEFLSILDEGLNIPESVFKVIPMSMIAYLLDKTPAHFKPKDNYLIEGLNSPTNDGIKDKMGFAGAKHSQTLLALALSDENFEHYTSLKDSNNANIHTLEFLLDDKLYSYAQTSSNQNFLTKLIRSHIGSQAEGAKDYDTGNKTGTKVETSGHSLLTDFGKDLATLATNLPKYIQITSKDNYEITDQYTKLGYDTLIVQAIEHYYHQDIKTYQPQSFFTLNNNTIQYTPYDLTHPKYHPYAQKWITEAYAQVGEAITHEDHEITFNQWNISLNDSAGIAQNYAKSQILISLGQTANFTSGDQDDLLFGSKQTDELIGGFGNDTIYGGEGNDTLKDNHPNQNLTSTNFKDNDLLVGGTGDDTLISTTGDDILKGGTGKDTYDFTTTTGTNHIKTYGTNHVYDDDNNGIIKMSNRIVEVGEKITENVYLSKDKFFILTKVANHQLGSYDIIIKENNADIKGTVTLHNWKKDGDLGLKFAETPLQPTGYNLIDYTDLPNGKIKGKAKVDEHNLFFTSTDFPENNDVVYKVTGGNKRDVIDFQNQKVSLKIEAGQGSDTIFAGEKDDIIWVDSYEEKTQMTPNRQLFYKWQLPSHVSVDTPPLDTKLVSVLPHDENNKILGDWTDFADGGAGNDKIYGFYGRDTLYGGIGNDTLIGAGNKDEILGGEGNDLIHGDGLVAKQFAPKYWNTASNKFGYMIDREDRENYQKQNTQLDWDLIENHNIASGMGAYLKREEIMVNLAYHDDDLLSGGKGEDIIIGEGGNDMIDGGEDDDIIMGDNINIESLFENEGIGAEKSFDLATETQSEKYLNKIKQWQAEFSGKDKLYGREGNDTIFAGSKSDYIEGNEGDDIIYADSDLLTTHIDNSLKQQTDFIHEYFKPETNKILRNQQTIFGDDKVLGGTGKDIIYGEGGNDTIDGGEDDDTLHGDANFFIHDEKTKPQHGNDKILGGLGKDTIYGGGGKDQIEAGDDDDIVYGDYSQDILDGKFHEADIIKAGLGNDKVWGQGESDTIHGEQGNDILVGDAVQSELDGQWHGNDILTGGEGEDTLYGTGGNDSLDGGDDNDYIRGDASDSQLTGNWHGNDIINGGQGDDMISGDGGKDIIYGGEGNDEISGDEQDVNIQHHDDDTLSGGQGDDKIWGDAGNDTLNGDEGDDYLDGDAQYLDNQYHGKDNINGGQGDDIIYGRGNDDVINGGEGDDKIYADDATFQDKLGKTKGNDTVHGGLGSDTIYGGAGDDKLYGDEGNDYLIAGTGTDYLYGGEGEDGYFFYTETMQDNTTKYITDIDNLGQIILDDDNLTDNDWQIITPLSENYLKSWTDNQGNIINQTNDGYILTHEGWHSNIHILTQASIDNILLGITLPNNRHHILNHAPTINKQLETQTVNLNDNITINLPDDLFYDADNDKLTLTATLADGTALPTWLNFDGKTLTGTATQKQNLAIKITATDPQGEQISQTFNLQTNSRPIANNTLQTKYDIKAGQSWQLDLPKNTFFDKDGDKLSYSATLTNGQPLPTGISIDSNTGQITSQSNQLGTYHINITATDPHGQTAQIQTTLNITNKVMENSQTFITGTFGSDVIFASHDKYHIIHGLSGHDKIIGGNKNDIIHGGTGADILYGLNGHDILNGGNGNDILVGGKGRDLLNGGLGTDILIGGENDDVLNGGSSNDRLIGGTGKDLMIGGYGNDIYHFNKGDGQDRIFDIQGNDTLQFGQGIGVKDIWFSKKGIDLQISLLNSDDTINIEGWFIMPNQRLENFTLATGETLSGNNIDNVIKAMNYHDQNMMNDSNFTNKIELYWEV